MHEWTLKKYLVIFREFRGRKIGLSRNSKSEVEWQRLNVEHPIPWGGPLVSFLTFL